MKDVINTAGYFASRAVVELSDGETLVPLVGYLHTNDTRTMERMAVTPGNAYAAGEQAIQSLSDDTRGAVFIRDLLVRREANTTDALLADIRIRAHQDAFIQIMLPYRNAAHPAGFELLDFEITELVASEPLGVQEIIDHFFDGARSYRRGAYLWGG